MTTYVRSTDILGTNNFHTIIKEYYYYSYGLEATDDAVQLYCNIISKDIFYDTDKTLRKNIFTQINTQINNLLIKYDCNPNILHFKEDVDLIIVFEKIVIKIFNITKNKNIFELYNEIIGIKSVYLENIYEAICINNLDLLFVVSKKIISPVDPTKINIDQAQIKIDIYQALTHLTNNNILHNDVSMDNIGFDCDTNNYVLFDFAGSKIVDDILNCDRSKHLMNNLKKLDKSITFNCNI